jgi:glycosyltransferase involved in cell wall biosynthesis
LIAGEGPCGPELRNLVEREGLLSRVHFLGSLPHETLLPLMFNSSGVIVPSIPCAGVIEATSLAVIESFACGVPVIASDLGGLAELIRSEITGFLFAPGDPVALGARLNEVLMMSTDERRRICEAAMCAAKERWDVLPWLAQIQAVYQSVLSGSGKDRLQ